MKGKTMFIIQTAVRRWLPFAATLALAACTVGPDYVRPTVEVPPVFKEMSSWKVAQPRDHVSRGKWWEIFNDPQLNILEEQVNVSNQNLAVAEAQFRQAQALVQVARAGYFPTVTAGASASRARRPVTTTSGSTVATTTSDYTLPLDVTWEVDIWGRVRRSVEAGRASAEASAADLEAVRLSIQAVLAQNYLQLRTLDADKQQLDTTVAYYRRSLELTQNRYASGVVSRSDVLLAETLLKTTEAQAIDVGVQRAQLEHAIALLLGRPASSFALAFAPLTAVPPDIPAALPSQLLERRPDIAAAERRVAAANAQIGFAEAAYYPTISLSGAVGFEASDLAKWLDWPSRFWSLGASVSETLFEGGLRGAQTEQARAAYDATVATYRQTVLTGFQEVEDNLSTLRILEQEARVQEEAVSAARRTREIVTNQYKAGIVSYLEVIVAQAATLNNERTAIDIAGRRLSASVLLVKALGGGWHAASLTTDETLDDKGTPRQDVAR
ncbi:MAG TPA: efflux transporter outer membrane subunit [Geobacteraceae bacterium]